MVSHRARLAIFFLTNKPDNVPKVDTFLEKYAGKEEAMFNALIQKYGAEPADPTGVRGRLADFYLQYAPDNVPKVDAILEKYAGKEDAMFKALVQKYGPEPDAGASDTVAKKEGVAKAVPEPSVAEEEDVGDEDANLDAQEGATDTPTKKADVADASPTKEQSSSPAAPAPIARVPTKAVYEECPMCNYVSKLSAYGLSEYDMSAAAAVHGSSKSTATGRNYTAMMMILLKSIPVGDLFQMEVGEVHDFKPIEVPIAALRRLHGAEEVERVRKLVANRGDDTATISDEARAHQEEAVFYAEEVATKEVLQPFAKLYFEAMSTIRSEVYEAEAALRMKMRTSFKATKEAWLHKAYILRQAIRCIDPLETERRNILSDEESLRWKGLVLWFQNKRAQIMKDSEIVENAMIESQMLLKRLRFKQLMEQSRTSVVEAERERVAGKWGESPFATNDQHHNSSYPSSPPLTERKRRHTDPTGGGSLEASLPQSPQSQPLPHRPLSRSDRQVSSTSRISGQQSANIKPRTAAPTHTSPQSTSSWSRMTPSGMVDPSTPEPIRDASFNGAYTVGSSYASPTFNSLRGTTANLYNDTTNPDLSASASRKAPTTTHNPTYKPAAASNRAELFKKSARRVLPKGGFSHM